MKDIPKDCIEVWHNLWITIFFYLSYAFLKCFKCRINVVLLELCHAFEVIESHLIRVIFNGRAAYLYDLIIIFCCPDILYQCQSSTWVIRFHLNGLLVNMINLCFRHVLHCHISSLHHNQVSILLFRRKCQREEIHDLCTIRDIRLLVTRNDVS